MAAADGRRVAVIRRFILARAGPRIKRIVAIA